MSTSIYEFPILFTTTSIYGLLGIQNKNWCNTVQEKVLKTLD